MYGLAHPLRLRLAPLASAAVTLFVQMGVAHAAPCPTTPYVRIAQADVGVAPARRDAVILGGQPSRLQQMQQRQAQPSTAAYQSFVPRPSAGPALILSHRVTSFRIDWRAAGMDVPRADAAIGTASAAPKYLRTAFLLDAPVAPVVSAAVFQAPCASPLDAPAGNVVASGEAEIAAAGHPDIFGSVSLPIAGTPLSAAWRSVGGASAVSASGPWASLVAENRGAARMRQAEAVNRWVNRRLHFTEDQQLYRRADYWASAAQSLGRGAGDCEDYAIAKMALLKTLGVPSEDLYLVIVRDLVRRADHAILSVRIDGRLYVLDNEADAVLPSGAVQDYRPVFTFSGNRAWTHGYRRQARPTMQMASLN